MIMQADLYEDRAKKLEEEVRRMINNKDTKLLTTLELIDDIERLGLGYRFNEEIMRALDRFVTLKGCEEFTNGSIHDTALSFRLLRQHGFGVSQDMFNCFKDRKGNFKECLGKDIKGLLSLHEASYLGFEGENLLDEAMEFTTMHLKDLKGDVSRTLKEEVRHSLEMPLHRRMRRLEQRRYIDAYNMKEAHNRKLLELAKLDFNIVQSVHQRDLKDMSRWWKEMGLGKKLSFARDRLMECFFWTVGMVFEPQFSNCRKELTKVTSLITIIDDVYDVYATLEELEMFTDIVQRWDVKAVKDLPEYMKLCFLALYNTVNEMVYETLKEQGVDILPYLTKAAFLQETKWRYYKRTPSSEDYLGNAWISVSGALILVHAYFLMSPSITNRALAGLEDYHNLLRWPSIIFRLCNDLGTSMAELERGETANSILCYMRETGLSEDFAREHISNLIDKTWKKMNKDRFSDSPFEEPFLETAINLARISHCTYQHGDGHGAPDSRSKDRVLSLIIEPIPSYDPSTNFHSHIHL
nr:putative terpene synthase 12 [Quercus suber]